MAYTLCSNYDKTKRPLIGLECHGFNKLLASFATLRHREHARSLCLLYFVICGFITSVPVKQLRIIWLNISLGSMPTDIHLQQNKKHERRPHV